MLLVWVNKHLTGPAAGAAVRVTDRDTREVVNPALVDRNTLRSLLPGNVRLVAGQGAGPEVRCRIAQMYLTPQAATWRVIEPSQHD